MLSIKQAINAIRATLEWPKVDARDGLTHRLHRYDRRAGMWRYACDQTFLENADVAHASSRPLTCVACTGMEGRSAFVLPP